jgi:hypothetical protein
MKLPRECYPPRPTGGPEEKPAICPGIRGGQADDAGSAALPEAASLVPDRRDAVIQPKVELSLGNMEEFWKRRSIQLRRASPTAKGYYEWGL